MTPTLSLTISGLHRHFGADHRVIIEVARIAEDAGIDQVVLPEHVVMSRNTDKYPYGDFPFPPSDPWVEPGWAGVCATRWLEHSRRADAEPGASSPDAVL